MLSANVIGLEIGPQGRVFYAKPMYSTILGLGVNWLIFECAQFVVSILLAMRFV